MRHCQGAPLICYISQGYGASRLTGPWRHKPRPPWRLSANPDAWHGLNRPMGAVQEPWMAMICFHRGQFQSCGISMNERNVFRWGWTEPERVRLLLPHITRSHSRSNRVSIINMRENLGLKHTDLYKVYLILKVQSPKVQYNVFSHLCIVNWSAGIYKNSISLKHCPHYRSNTFLLK